MAVGVLSAEHIESASSSELQLVQHVVQLFIKFFPSLAIAEVKESLAPPMTTRCGEGALMASLRRSPPDRRGRRVGAVDATSWRCAS